MISAVWFTIMFGLAGINLFLAVYNIKEKRKGMALFGGFSFGVCIAVGILHLTKLISV